MSLSGRPILDHYAPSSGLIVENPTYEHIEVAREYGYRPFPGDSWEGLSSDDKALLIAHRRLKLHAEAVLAHRQARQSDHGQPS